MVGSRRRLRPGAALGKLLRIDDDLFDLFADLAELGLGCQSLTQEPLLKDLIKYVMKDESRHVAFGVVSLKDFYDDMPAGELRDREDFIIYACELMRNRLVGDQIARAMGWNRDEVKEHVLASEPAMLFRRMLFARVVPNLKRLGLLSPRVREAFSGLGILEFENADPEEQDRALGLA